VSMVAMAESGSTNVRYSSAAVGGSAALSASTIVISFTGAVVSALATASPKATRVRCTSSGASGSVGLSGVGLRRSHVAAHVTTNTVASATGTREVVAHSRLSFTASTTVMFWIPIPDGPPRPVIGGDPTGYTPELSDRPSITLGRQAPPASSRERIGVG
jgi:hypothetical protein